MELVIYCHVISWVSEPFMWIKGFLVGSDVYSTGRVQRRNRKREWCLFESPPSLHAASKLCLLFLAVETAEWTKINELVLGDQKNRTEIQSKAMAIYILKGKPLSSKKSGAILHFRTQTGGKEPTRSFSMSTASRQHCLGAVWGWEMLTVCRDGGSKCLASKHCWYEDCFPPWTKLSDPCPFCLPHRPCAFELLVII